MSVSLSHKCSHSSYLLVSILSRGVFVTANKTICNVVVSLLNGCPCSCLCTCSGQKPLINTQSGQGLSSVCSPRQRTDRGMSLSTKMLF